MESSFGLSPINDTPISPLTDTLPISPLYTRFVVSSIADSCSAQETAQLRRIQSSSSTPRKPRGQLKKVGKVPLHKKYPEIISTATNKLVDTGYGAHRRRTETRASVGVRAKTLKETLVNEVDGLSSLSESSVRRLFAPPNKGHKAGARYHHVIDAKIGTKNNDQSTESRDSHYCRASVKYALEMGACFYDEVHMISADDKNKLSLSKDTPCINRYQKFNSYFLKGDEYHYSDHSFPPGTNLFLVDI